MSSITDLFTPAAPAADPAATAPDVPAPNDQAVPAAPGATDSTLDPVADLVGKTFHYTGTGTQVAGHWFDYGEEITIAAETIERTRDRFGQSSLVADLLDPEHQRHRWGQAIWLPGPWPADRLRYFPGSRQWLLARAAAYDAANAVVGEQSRKDARAEAARLFGPNHSGNPTDWPASYGSELDTVHPDGSMGKVLDPRAGLLTAPLPALPR